MPSVQALELLNARGEVGGASKKARIVRALMDTSKNAMDSVFAFSSFLSLVCLSVYHH